MSLDRSLTNQNLTPTIENNQSNFLKSITVWDGTNSQAEAILALRYPDGTTIINGQDYDSNIEIINLLRKNDFNLVLQYLKSVTNYRDLIWNQPSLYEQQFNVQREILIEQTREQAVKGAGKCRFCFSTEITFSTKQQRSGDEPETIIYRCIRCDKMWKV